MRIGIDVRALSFGECGITRYINSLLEQLVLLDKDNTYVLYLNKYQEIDYIKRRLNFSIEVIPATFLIYKYILLPFCLIKDKIDVFHTMTHELPMFVFCKKVSTFYDLNLEKLPHLYLLKLRLLSYLGISEYSAKAADKIIAISENTKLDLVKIYKVPANKISVTLLAADQSFKPIDKKAASLAVSKRIKTDQPFVLYVGQIRERKNFSRMLDAFKVIKQRGLPHKLVLIGHNEKGIEFYDLNTAIDSRGLSKDVIYIPDCNGTYELSLFYNACDLFLYVSLYEGFGLPILEAMSCAAPVVTSNLASMPEVAGDAAMLINPYNTLEISDAMFNVLTNEKLREKLITKGIERAQRFSWEKTAQQTLSVYQSFFANPNA